MIKIRNYTDKEIEYIQKNYDKMSVRDLAISMNKRADSVSRMARILGLTKQIHKKWTDEDNQFLQQHYTDMTFVQIAKILDRTVASVRTQADRLNIQRLFVWTDEETKFLIKNNDILTHQEIAKQLGKTVDSITAKCFDLRLVKKNPPWEQKDIEFVKQNYKEMSTTDISTILNRSPSAIKTVANKMGLKKSPYYCDYHYFDKIDNEEKAYWLGFISADGWVSQNKDSRTSAVGIELQYNDINHLKKFNQSISGNYKIVDRWKTCNLSKDKDKLYHMCNIRIYSTIMYNSLFNLGLTNHKSFDLSIPNISQNLLRHYIRGYFDGDGCFVKTNKSFHLYLLTASEQMRNDLCNLLDTLKIDFRPTTYISDFGTPMFSMQIDRYESKIRFLEYMYKDSTIYLSRKYQKYLKVLKEIPNTNITHLTCEPHYSEMNKNVIKR